MNTPGQPLASVADKVAIEQFPAGAVIVRQGDPGDKFYLIRKGTAAVSVHDEIERTSAGSRDSIRKRHRSHGLAGGIVSPHHDGPGIPGIHTVSRGQDCVHAHHLKGIQRAVVERFGDRALHLLGADSTDARQAAIEA